MNSISLSLSAVKEHTAHRSLDERRFCFINNFPSGIEEWKSGKELGNKEDEGAERK
jgi:hypothetical protein